jgi:4-amino-4-deoxy-L-arabinose transferase-like glycosyltransferase
VSAERAGSPPIERLFPAFLLALLAVAGLLRVHDIEADPPKTLSWSQGIYTDAAVVVHNARNQVLWGDPVVDYGIDMYWFPLSHVVTLAAFGLLGVSTAAARSGTVLLALATIALIAAGLRAEGNARRALLAVFFLAVSFPYIMYNRLALAEPAMVLLIAASFAAFARGAARRSDRWIGVSGFFAAAAPLFGKAHAVYLPAVGVAALIAGPAHDRTGRRIGAFAAGCAVAALAWGALLLASHGRQIVDHYLHESIVKHEKDGASGSFLAEAAGNAIRMGSKSGFLSRDLVVVTLGFAALPLLVARRRAAGVVESGAVRFAAFWLLFGWAFLACVKAPAPRYLSALVPALSVLAADLLVGVRGAPRDAGPAARRAVGRRGAAPRATAVEIGAFFMLALLAAATAIAHVGRLSSAIPALDPISRLVPAAASRAYPWNLLPGALVAAVVATALALGRGARVAHVPRAAAAALIAPSVALAAVQYAGWSTHARHDIVGASREIGRLLGPDAHLVGAYAPAVCLDNRLRVSPYFGPEYMGPEKDPDLFARYGISHLLLVGPDELRIVKERYPDVYDARLVPVKSFPFDSQYSQQMVLFRVPEAIAGRTIHRYAPTEAELAAEAETERVTAARSAARRAPDEGASGAAGGAR